MKAGVTLATIVLASLLVAASPATASVRYASPSGSPSSPACSPAPCDLQTAVESAADGDEVVVDPGTYVESDELDVSAAILVRGDRRATLHRSWSRRRRPPSRVTSPGALLRGLTVVHSGKRRRAPARRRLRPAAHRAQLRAAVRLQRPRRHPARQLLHLQRARRARCRDERGGHDRLHLPAQRDRSCHRRVVCGVERRGEHWGGRQPDGLQRDRQGRGSGHHLAGQ